MSILIYAETQDGQYSKSAFELASYAHALASTLNTSVTALAVNASDPKSIERYGVNKVLEVKNTVLSTFSAQLYANVISASR